MYRRVKTLFLSCTGRFYSRLQGVSPYYKHEIKYTIFDLLYSTNNNRVSNTVLGVADPSNNMKSA